MDAAEVAREVNARIRELAELYALGQELPLAFLCECGCFTLVPLTIAEYDGRAGPVAAPVHETPAAEP
jgi:hypothetical protein